MARILPQGVVDQVREVHRLALDAKAITEMAVSAMASTASGQAAQDPPTLLHVTGVTLEQLVEAQETLATAVREAVEARREALLMAEQETPTFTERQVRAMVTDLVLGLESESTPGEIDRAYEQAVASAAGAS